MSRSHARVAFSLAALLLVSATVRGQVATGFPPYGSFAPATFDTVNNANLNVHFAIPIISKAGRGLPFSYTLTYDSSFWYPMVSWMPMSNGWGWSGGKPIPVMGYIEYGTTQGSCTVEGVNYYYDIYMGFVYNDPLGTTHSFPLSPLWLSNGQNTPCPNVPPYSGTATASDGSGYTMSASAAPWAAATSRSGVAIYTPPDNPDPQSGSGEMTDPNSNSVTGSYIAPTDTFTDTLGATVLTITDSGSPIASRTFAYTTPSGGTAQVVAYYTPTNIKTNFGCPGITEYSASNIPLITEILMPDNSTYTFTYEQTPPGNTGYYTGRLASVTLPTGGKISYVYSGGNNGITCADGTTATLQRSTPDTGSNYWQYAHTENGAAWYTAITDPQGNATVMNFQGVYETERQVYQTSTLLETANTCYNGASIPCNSTGVALPISSRTVQVTFPNLSPAQTSTSYNTYGLPTETDEYVYGPTLTRKTLTTYNTSLTNIYDRPSEVQVEDSGGTVWAQTTYAYDNFGNRTGETRSTGGTPSTISRSFGYGSYGVLTSQTDFNANTTSYSNFTCGTSSNAFPQTVTLPNSLSESISWNCNVALPNWTIDVNGNKTTYSYDSMLRLTGIGYPDGGSVGTTFTNPNETDLETAVTTSASRHDQLDWDGLGRVHTSALVNDPDGETYVVTSYDVLGRTLTVSNPYRTSSQGGDTYTYDPLNRVTEVTHADSSNYQIAYGDSTSQDCPASAYGYGYSALYTDESGNPRQTFTDALGRVIEADEPTSASKTLSVYTCYKYDVLNDLTEVYQGSSEIRKYAYDMLSRVTQVATPEAKNNTKYFYYTTSSNTLCAGDPSAVCRRTDERGITTTYTYDALNRPGYNPSTAAMSYSNGDLSVYYLYDQTSYNGLTIANGKGQRTGMSDASGQTGWSYDPMGRVAAEERTIGSATKTLSYGYNEDGSLASVTYPSGRTVTYTPTAVGRARSAVDTGDSIHYATSAVYAPQGALETADYGSNITFSATYNSRLLPSLLQGSTISPSTTFFELEPTYNPNTTVSGVTNLLTSGRTQSFTYDYLNRIVTAKSTATSGTYCWGQSIPTNGTGYDRYGNLWIIDSTQCSAPALNLMLNTYNQITNSGFSYDASGDMTSDGSNNYTWNAESRLTSAASVNYTYDGDGKRVEKSSGTYYWFSPAGIPLAETDTSGNTLNEYIYFTGGRTARRDSLGNVYYYFSDQIGTAQLIFNATSGAVCYDSDSTPFGYQMVYTNSCPQEYEFAGMELDSETNNYATWFRNYEPNLGRWLSPDPLGGDVTNPQSLNRYPYVMNNPTGLNDPLGLQPIAPCDPGDPDCCDPTDPSCEPPFPPGCLPRHLCPRLRLGLPEAEHLHPAEACRPATLKATVA